MKDNTARGLPPEPARSTVREARQFPRIETIRQDLRSGLRGIRQSPGFSLVVILTLALGIGANTAIFSVVYAVLLRTPPYPAGERLVELWEATSGQNIPVSWINFQHWRHENHTFEDMAGFETADLTLTGRGDAVLTHAGVVSSSFFRLTGWRPQMGRLFTEADDRTGAAPIVLVSGEFRARMLSGDPHVVGSTLILDGRAYQVIGTLPPGLRFFTRPVDFYLPAGPRDGKTVNRAEHGSMVLLGLLKPGVTLAAARADLDAIMRRLALSDPGPERNHHTSISWLADFGTDDIRPTLLLLMAAVGLVLIIACANVASLLLVRSTTRTREMAIRSAIGARRSRLARQLITENFVIAALGGGAGLLLAGTCLRALVFAAPRDIPRLWEARLNLPVLSFTLAVTVITGLVAGLAPVVNAGRLDRTEALKEGSPSAGGGKRRYSLRSGLVVVEIAITLVLAFGCGLLLRSLVLAQTSYPGFHPDGLLALELQLPPSRYKSDQAVRQFYARLMQDLRREPGVESVGAVNCPPSTGGCAKGWYSIADMPPPDRADVPLTLLSSVDPAYFHTMGIPLLAGRSFTDRDRDSGPGVVVVNEKLARHWWPAKPQLAVGHPIKFGGPYMEGSTYEIAGVVGDVRQSALDVAPFSEVYVTGAQKAMVVLIRASGDPARLIPAVRRELASIDRNVAVQSLRPFEQWMGATLERRRFSTLLLGIFATLAVTLSSVGIYGILNYWVSLRQKEIAIRLTLGAQRLAILRWAGWHAMRLVAMGIAAGVFGCWGASQWLKNMVFGISARNPAMLLVSAAAVIALAALAAAVPAYRATQVDPIRNLHDA